MVTANEVQCQVDQLPLHGGISWLEKRMARTRAKELQSEAEADATAPIRKQR